MIFVLTAIATNFPSVCSTGRRSHSKGMTNKIVHETEYNIPQNGRGIGIQHE